MLSPKEMEFVAHWERVRGHYGTFGSKLKRGLPQALLFTLPVLCSVAAVYFLSPDWFAKIANQANGSAAAILTALLLCVFFFSFVRMHFQWEMNEQAYTELKARLTSSEAAAPHAESTAS